MTVGCAATSNILVAEVRDKLGVVGEVGCPAPIRDKSVVFGEPEILKSVMSGPTRSSITSE